MIDVGQRIVLFADLIVESTCPELEYHVIPRPGDVGADHLDDVWVREERQRQELLAELGFLRRELDGDVLLVIFCPIYLAE